MESLASVRLFFSTQAITRTGNLPDRWVRKGHFSFPESRNQTPKPSPYATDQPECSRPPPAHWAKAQSFQCKSFPTHHRTPKQAASQTHYCFRSMSMPMYGHFCSWFHCIQEPMALLIKALMIIIIHTESWRSLCLIRNRI